MGGEVQPYDLGRPWQGLDGDHVAGPQRADLDAHRRSSRATVVTPVAPMSGISRSMMLGPDDELNR